MGIADQSWQPSMLNISEKHLMAMYSIEVHHPRLYENELYK